MPFLKNKTKVVPYNGEGYQGLIEWPQCLVNEQAPCGFAREATGAYHPALALFL